MRQAEWDLYNYIATRPVTMIMSEDGDGEVTIVPFELSWEQRALIAEDKIAALVEGLESDEGWDHMMIYNPLAVAIATIAVNRYIIEP